MEVRCYVDPSNGEPHLWLHGVTEHEAEEHWEMPSRTDPEDWVPGSRSAELLTADSSE
jgi:hypothetical protein